MVRSSVSTPTRQMPAAMRSASHAQVPTGAPSSSGSVVSDVRGCRLQVSPAVPTTARSVTSSHLDPGHEAHAVEERDQRRPGAGLGVRQERLAVVDAGEPVLDASLRRQQQQVGGLARRQVLDVLGGEGVQPGEPVGTADADDVAVRQVDEPVAGHQASLLAGDGAVVRGDAGVGWVGLDGSVEVEERAAIGVRHAASLPHRCDCISWPSAAMSKAYIRSPSTSPYMRWPAVYSLAVSGAGDDVGGQGDARAVDLAVPDLGEAGGVRQHQLDGAVTGRAGGSRSRGRPDGCARRRRR